VKTVCGTIFAIALCLFSVRALAQGQRTQTADSSLPKSVRVLDAATPLRTGPGVTYPIVVTEAAGAVLEVTGRDGDWYRITLSPDMVSDPNAPRTVYVLARLVSTVMGSINTPQGIPTSQPPPPPQPESEVLLGGHFVLDYDAGVWTRTALEQPGSFQLAYRNGDISARVMSGRSQIQLDKIADIELASIKQTDPTAHLIDRGFETVNGRKMATFQILASAGGIESWYYEQCYSDSTGTVEIVGITAFGLAQQAGPVLDKLVDGLRIVRK
jgi:hypothetical protein